LRRFFWPTDVSSKQAMASKVPNDDIEVGTTSEALTFSTRPSLGGLGTQGPSLPTPSKCDVAFANCVDGCNAWGTWLGEEFVDRCTFSCEEQRIDCRFPGGPVDPFPT
jgi:hypothetical protein